jgi:hypothetical protein
MEFEGDYEDYGDKDGDEGTVASQFSKQSIDKYMYTLKVKRKLQKSS